MKPRDRRGEDQPYYWDRGTKNVMVEVEEGDVIHVRRCQGLEELRCSRQGGKGASLLHSQTIMEASSDVVDLAGPIGGPCWHETCWADLSGVRETLSCLQKENQNLQCNKTTTRGQGVDGIRHTRKPCRQATTCGPPFACHYRRCGFFNVELSSRPPTGAEVCPPGYGQTLDVQIGS